MKIFVLWRAAPTPERGAQPVGARLQSLFGPLFESAPELQVRSTGGVHLAWLELPVKGFRAPFFEEEDGEWAFAPEYPLNARRLLRAHGAKVNGGPVLPALGRELARRPEPYVRELIPPACLLWSSGGASSDGEVRVQNDGLGQAQLFEYRDESIWVLTNKVLALRALGVPLKPVAHEWAARFVTHWFPLDRTGYEGVRYLAGGTQLRVSARGVERTRIDALDSWVRPPAMKREDAFELGRHALLNTLSDAIELWEKPTVGLSGGWDSRTVASCLRVLDTPFELRVRGQETHFDVIISAELARMAGLPHRIKSEGGIPPGTAEGARASIAKALLWQGGNFATLKHKNFLAKEKRRDGLDGGVVNVMGQHAGLGKADFVVRVKAHEHAPERYEELLLTELLQDAPPILRADTAAQARELVRDSYRAAAERGLTGLEPLLFFYLNEFTRRWGAATVAGQTGVVVAPFLCPDMIRACYALPSAELASKPLHRYITQRHAPDWAAYPYADQVTEEDFAAGRLPRVELAKPRKEEPSELPRWREVRHHKKYNYKFYWKDVGLPLLEEAFAQGGFWTEIFDADRARTAWDEHKTGPDALAIAHLLPRVLDGSLPAS